MKWFEKHADTVMVLGGILASVMWMNGQFNDVRKEIREIDKRLSKVETILYVRGLVSHQLAAVEKCEHSEGK